MVTPARRGKRGLTERCSRAQLFTLGWRKRAPDAAPPALWLVALVVLGTELWAVWLSSVAQILLAYARRVPRVDVWLYDWNVYHAAAGDLIDRTLYRMPLLEPGHALPIGTFNYPPLAAGWALPLLPLGREPGGIVWLMAGVVAIAAGALLGARALGLRWIWAWVIAGAAVAVYPWTQYFTVDVTLGNNNHLIFALMAGFMLAHLGGHQRVAGVLLALAIGTKLWPLALVVLLVRERRWSELRWATGVLAAQGVVTLVWLGPDVLAPMAGGVLGQNLAHDTGIAAVLWTTAFGLMWDWWPAWGGYAVAAGLLLVPASGRLGLGLGIIAGLSLNTNLWHHYAPVFVLGLAMVGVGAFRRLHRRQLASCRPDTRLRLT